jgi:hypothetical protein
VDRRWLNDGDLLVSADELQARGVAQGALISLQFAREREPLGRNAAAFKRQELELIETHRAELLGPLARFDVELAWRRGFITELRLEVRGIDELEVLFEATTLPAFARLERLGLELVNVVELEAFAERLPPSLRHLEVKAPASFTWEPLLEALPPLGSLSLLGGESIDFEGLSFPTLTTLHLGTDADHLTSEVAPALRALSGNPPESMPEQLALVRLEQWWGDDLEVPPHARVVFESTREEPLEPPVVSRVGWGVAHEHAWLLVKGAPALERALTELPSHAGLTASVASLELASQPVVAIELRQPGADALPNGEALEQLGLSLARQGAQVLEFAFSHSNADTIAWTHTCAGKTALAMGPFKERAGLWRRAFDQAFGFDPGATLDDVLLALCVGPRALDGQPLDDAREGVIVTGLTPATSQSQGYDDLDADPDDEDWQPSVYDGVTIPDAATPRDWWAADAQEERAALPDEAAEAVEGGVFMPAFEAPEEEAEDAEAPPEPDEEFSFDAANADWTEVVEESPVDLEADGQERNPEYGLEPDSFDPDTVQAEPGEDCAVCGRNGVPVLQCRGCSRWICARCVVAAPGVDGLVSCTDCPPVKPRAISSST